MGGAKHIYEVEYHILVGHPAPDHFKIVSEFLGIPDDIRLIQRHYKCKSKVSSVDAKTAKEIVEICLQSRINIAMDSFEDSHSVGYFSIIYYIGRALNLDYCRLIDNNLRTHLSAKSGYYPKSIDEFIGFSRKVTPVLAEIATNEEEVGVALELIISRIGNVEVEADDAYSGSGAYPGFNVNKFEVVQALVLIQDKERLKRLIQKT